MIILIKNKKALKNNAFFLELVIRLELTAY